MSFNTSDTRISHNHLKGILYASKVTLNNTVQNGSEIPLPELKCEYFCQMNYKIGKTKKIDTKLFYILHLILKIIQYIF